MIKIKLLKNVTIMSDSKSTNPKDRKILSKKISGLKFSWLIGLGLNFQLAIELVNKMIDSQEISEIDFSRKIYRLVLSTM